MSCMCGDTMCPSCGPAQGYNVEFECVYDWLFEDVLCDFPSGFDIDWLAEEMANRLGKNQPQYLVDALERRGREWVMEKENRKYNL